MKQMLERGQIRLLTIDLDEGKEVQTVPKDHSWVRIKEKKTVSDTGAINAATVEGKITTREGEQIELGRMNLGAPLVQTLIQMVQEWGGPAFCMVTHENGDKPSADHQHQAVAIDPHVLATLYDEPAQVIFQTVNQHNPRPNAGGNPTRGDGKKS